MPPIGPFLDRALRTPFAYGSFDCILYLADWSLARGLGDPAAPYRGRYAGALSAARIIGRAGGLAGLVAREFEPLGWTPAATAAAGDIGLVLGATGEGQALGGAIHLGGDRWAALGPKGLLISAFRVERVWEARCPTS